MSFEIKYDREGQPLPLEKQTMPAQQTQPTPGEEPRKLHPELQIQAETPAIQVADDAVEPVADNLETTEVQPEPITEVKAAQEFQLSYQNQRNIKYMRERAELADKLERERDELARKLAESQKPQQQPEEDYNLGLGENDLAEGKHLTKVQKEIVALKKELNQYKQQTTQQQTEARIKNQFPDFDSVVSQENIRELGAQFPEIYSTLNSGTDLYATAVSAYTMIKKLGIGEQPVYNANKEQAIKNLAKPRPLNSIAAQVGDSPLGKADQFANGLTPELQKQLYKEMLAAKSGY